MAKRSAALERALRSRRRPRRGRRASDSGKLDGGVMTEGASAPTKSVLDRSPCALRISASRSDASSGTRLPVENEIGSIAVAQHVDSASVREGCRRQAVLRPELGKKTIASRAAAGCSRARPGFSGKVLLSGSTARCVKGASESTISPLAREAPKPCTDRIGALRPIAAVSAHAHHARHFRCRRPHDAAVSPPEDSKPVGDVWLHVGCVVMLPAADDGRSAQ